MLKHLYFLDEDSLWLVIDNLAYDKYPAESDLLKGESVQRMSFHFIRVKKK